MFPYDIDDVALYPAPRQLHPIKIAGNCNNSPFGIHIPDSFTLEGDLSHEVEASETIRFTICCRYCRSVAVGAIGLTDMEWEETALTNDYTNR